MYKTEMTAAQVAYAVADLLVEHGLVTKAEETRAVEFISDQLNQLAMVEEEAPERPMTQVAHVQKMDADPFMRKCVNDAIYDSRTLERVTPSEQVRKGIAKKSITYNGHPVVMSAASAIADDFNTKKIRMIKQLRDETGAGLLEAKLSVEAANVEYESAKERYYQMYNPERLSAAEMVAKRASVTGMGLMPGSADKKPQTVFEKMKKRYG